MKPLHVGHERPRSVVLPPVSMRLNGYVVGYDSERGEAVYACGPGYDGFGLLWGFDGERFAERQASKVRLEGEGPYQGYYDPTRGGVVAFQFGWDFKKKVHLPLALLVTDQSAQELPLSGDVPVPHEDASGDLRGIFAYDHARKLGVCLTPLGVWTLDARSSWSRAATLDESQLIQDWHNDGQGVWDPVGERVVFSIFCGDNYVHRFYSWDGAEFSELSVDGLPAEEEGVRAFHVGLFRPSAMIAGHPMHGVVLVDGPSCFAFGTSWVDLGTLDPAPARMEGGRMVFDEKRERFLIGPGFHDGDGGGRAAQQVFYDGDTSGFTAFGFRAKESPVERLSGGRFYFECGGRSHVISSRSLHTFAWNGDEWVELLSEKAAQALSRADIGAVIGMGDHALAVTTVGDVFRFDGTWSKTEESLPDFGERSEFTIARRGDTADLVIWGGEVKNRKSNDTFARRGGTWSKNKKASPRPSDFSHGNKDDIYVDFTMFWDFGLQRFVRIGYDEVFVLDPDDAKMMWQAYDPSGYRELAGERRWHHVPATDPETGETLLFNIEGGRIVRFDLKVCAQVSTLELPEGLATADDAYKSAWAFINEDLWWEPSERRMRAQNPDDFWAQFAWDAAPLFEAVAAMGPRATLAAEAKSAASSGKRAKNKNGDAGELDPDALASLITQEESFALSVGDPVDSLEDLSCSRIGGLPSGVSKKAWPKAGEHLGFLLQIETSNVLKKHNAVAVFCSRDGEHVLEALLIKPAAWGKAPIPKAPGDVPVLRMRPIEHGESQLEVIEARVQALASRDPELAARCDAFAASERVWDEPPSNKQGGPASWVQSPAVDESWTLVAQIDCDHLSFDDEAGWQDAGLCGVLFVLVSPDEKKATALIQYT